MLRVINNHKRTTINRGKRHKCKINRPKYCYSNYIIKYNCNNSISSVKVDKNNMSKEDLYYINNANRIISHSGIKISNKNYICDMIGGSCINIFEEYNLSDPSRITKDKKYIVEYSNTRDFKRIKKITDVKYIGVSSHIHPNIKSIKAFYRWCRKQNVPENTKFILESNLNGICNIEYTIKYPKIKRIKTKFINTCSECASHLTILNYMKKYECIRCSKYGHILYRKDRKEWY